MRNMAKINPFDIIKTTQDIPARVFIHIEDHCTEAIDISLPKGSLLFSNTRNYNAISELSFIPHLESQFDSIKNLYLHKATHIDKVQGYTYRIKAADLNNNYEITKIFEYNQLKPNSTEHIRLLANLYLDGKILELNTKKLLCFISDRELIEKIKSNFEIGLLTKKEAQSFIAYQIKEQIKLRQQ